MKMDDIALLIDHLDKSSLVELELKSEEFELSLRKGDAFSRYEGDIDSPVSSPVRPKEAQVEKGERAEQGEAVSKETEQTGENADLILSPIVGTFYRSPSPDSPAFAEEGKELSSGDTICILEAMKVMNELEAEYDCRIEAVLVENGQLVEYGTPLFRVTRL